MKFFDRWSKTILLGAIVLFPVLLWGARVALQTNRNDVTEWLPQGLPETEAYDWFQEHFPHEAFVLVSWQGATLDDPRVERFARALEAPREGKRYFRNVLSGPRLIEFLESRYPSLSREDVLQRLEGSLIGPDHRYTALLATLAVKETGTNFAPALAQVRAVAAELGIPPAELHMGGPPVDNVAVDVEGERMIIRLSVLSALVGIIICWLVFRSLRLVFLVFSAGLLAAGVGTASVPFTGGTVDAILLSMPPLVYILAISGGIHLINYYHDNVREHGLPRAPERMLRDGWLPTGMAALTTALGLGSLVTSQIVPIRKFGLYSAWGVLATLAILFLFVPAFLHFFPSRKLASEAARPRQESGPTRLQRLLRPVGDFIIRWPNTVLAGTLALMLALGLGVSRIETSVRLIEFFSPEAEIIRDYTWLEDRLGPLVPVEVIVRFDNRENQLNFAQRMRLVQQVEGRIEQLDEVGGALSAGTFAPNLDAPQAPRGVPILGSPWLRESVLSRQLERHRKEFAEYLSTDPRTGEELWRISARVWALKPIDYGIFVGDLQQVVAPVLADYRQRGVMGVSTTITGMIPVVYKAQHELMRGLRNSLLLAFLQISAVIMLYLRQFTGGLLSMLPNLFPVAVIFGALGWSGIVVDVGTMMTASVALGVAVDDTIHFLSWFRDGLKQGMPRREAIAWAYDRCGPAMIQSTAINSLGLAMFALSDFVPTQRFGLLMLTLLATALLGALVMLPALLAGPLGRFFEIRGRRPRGPQSPAEPVPEEAPQVA